MDTKKMVLNAILIAIGVILHAISPSFGLPAQPDFALAMFFIIMLINRDYKTTIFAGIIIGIFTALTTKSPGGQLPNIIDKVITCNVMYLLMLPLREKVSNNIQGIILFVFGTLLSGTVFLTSLALISGVEGAILTTIFAVVVPTAVVNVIAGMIIYKIVEQAMRITKYNI